MGKYGNLFALLSLAAAISGAPASAQTSASATGPAAEVQRSYAGLKNNILKAPGSLGLLVILLIASLLLRRS